MKYDSIFEKYSYGIRKAEGENSTFIYCQGVYKLYNLLGEEICKMTKKF